MKQYSDHLLRKYLLSNAKINLPLLDECLSFQKVKFYAKGEFLVRAGDISRYIYFVEKGLLRTFYLDEKGREHILQFAPENWISADHESIYYQNPTMYYIQALEESQIHLLDQTFFDRLASVDQVFNQFNIRLLHNHINQLQKRIISLIANSAEERYRSFSQHYPDIIARVPQIMVASYLGIAPESLSRIRREMAQKHQSSDSSTSI